ncbi:EF-hand [Lichtheimia hyalospora FSU 10163]|nr:EF-hand [Lichtheimia hyalospora FSU 10163]
MRQKEIRQAFNAADTVGAGLLDSEATCTALELLELPVLDKALIEDLVISEGEEGYVDLDGFKVIVQELVESSSPSSSHQKLQDAYRLLADDSGVITLESLRHASQQEDWSLQQLEEMMNEADINHDGIIDMQEFKRVWNRSGM